MSVKTVFITGATGVVGSAVVPLFLQEPATEIRLLLRARSDSELQARLDKLFEFWEPELQGLADASSARTRVQAVRGDVSVPRLGLSEAVYDQLGSEVTHIVHSAANVKMKMSAQEAHQTSVVSTTEIAALAEKCRRKGQFHKLDYISTLGVAGKMTGLIPEEPLLAKRAFHNTYESSKAEAEEFILEKLKEGLPVTIHRPSMVVGNSQTGKIIHFQIFYYLSEFLTGKSTYGMVPIIKNVKLDTIPADYVAKALYWSSANDSCTGKILHLCSGPDKAMDVALLTETLRDILAVQGEKLPRLHLIPLWLFRSALPVLKWVAPTELKKAVNNLSLFLDYIDDRQLFANSNTNAILSAAGILLPSPEDYLNKVIAYSIAHKRK